MFGGGGPPYVYRRAHVNFPTPILFHTPGGIYKKSKHISQERVCAMRTRLAFRDEKIRGSRAPGAAPLSMATAVAFVYGLLVSFYQHVLFCGKVGVVHLSSWVLGLRGPYTGGSRVCLGFRSAPLRLNDQSIQRHAHIVSRTFCPVLVSLYGDAVGSPRNLVSDSQVVGFVSL